MRTVNVQDLPFQILIASILIVGFSNHAPGNEIPDGADRWKELGSDSVSVFVSDNSIWLQLDTDAIERQRAVIPRLCAPIRSIQWAQPDDIAIKFVPEPKEWVFSWKGQPKGNLIEVAFDSRPLLPKDCAPAMPAGDSSIMLQAYQASTFGEKLRFEPQWYKNTVGYWAVESDYATWKMTVDQAGTYSVALLQGCGKGHGGSDAIISIHDGDKVESELPFRTIDTGHFQNFRWNHLGMVEISKPGSYELRVSAKRIAKVALFDVRTIHLVLQANPDALK